MKNLIALCLVCSFIFVGFSPITADVAKPAAVQSDTETACLFRAIRARRARAKACGGWYLGKFWSRGC